MQWIRSPGYEDIKSRATGTGIQSNVDRDQSNGYPDSKQPVSELKAGYRNSGQLVPVCNLLDFL